MENHSSEEFTVTTSVRCEKEEQGTSLCRQSQGQRVFLTTCPSCPLLCLVWFYGFQMESDMPYLIERQITVHFIATRTRVLVWQAVAAALGLFLVFSFSSFFHHQHRQRRQHGDDSHLSLHSRYCSVSVGRNRTVATLRTKPLLQLDNQRRRPRQQLLPRCPGQVRQQNVRVLSVEYDIRRVTVGKLRSGNGWYRVGISHRWGRYLPGVQLHNDWRSWEDSWV